MPAPTDHATSHARPPLSDELVRPSKQPRRREAPSRRVSLGWRQDYRWDHVEANLCLPQGGESNGGLQIDLFASQATVPPVRVRLHMSEAALTALQFPFGWQDADRIDRVDEFPEYEPWRRTEPFDFPTGFACVTGYRWYAPDERKAWTSAEEAVRLERADMVLRGDQHGEDRVMALDASQLQISARQMTRSHSVRRENLAFSRSKSIVSVRGLEKVVPNACSFLSCCVAEHFRRLRVEECPSLSRCCSCASDASVDPQSVPDPPPLHFYLDRSDLLHNQ